MTAPAHFPVHRTPLHRPDEMRLAAIDVGSNSIHMVIAQADADGAVTTLWTVKEMVGLGRISFPSRRLTAEAMDRAIVTLHRFALEARRRQCEQVLAVATSAVREAINGGAFIERVRLELGLHIRVVSARGEAELIYLGVRHAMGLGKEPCLIIDVGGGSVEFIVGDNRQAQLLESRKLGAARMTAQFVQSDPIEPDDLRRLKRHYDRELTPVLAAIGKLRPVRIIGTSGTLENLAAMTGGLARSGDAGPTRDHVRGGAGNDRPNGLIGVLERGPLERILGRLIKSRSEERAVMKGLDDQRKDQIVAGALLVREIFERLDLKRIELCRSALREGMLIEHLAHLRPELEIRRDVPDPRRRAVIDLARRCQFQREHAEQVARLTVRLFDEMRELHGLRRSQRELIEYGALLHDIGAMIGGSGHHKHSAYLIQNGDLNPFTAEEIATIACIARYHRRSPPRRKHRLFATLSDGSRRTVLVGAALLRIGDGLDRTNCSVVSNLRCQIGRKRVRIRLDTRGDAALEAWSAQARSGLCEEVFDRKVELIARIPRRK